MSERSPAEAATPSWDLAESAADTAIVTWIATVLEADQVPGTTGFLSPLEGRLLDSLAGIYQVRPLALSELAARLHIESDRQPFARVLKLLTLLSPALRRQVAIDAARFFAAVARDHFQQRSPLRVAVDSPAKPNDAPPPPLEPQASHN